VRTADAAGALGRELPGLPDDCIVGSRALLATEILSKAARSAATRAFAFWPAGKPRKAIGLENVLVV
jgi:hypothetical protein